ncbi:MAG: XdhC/CoxI family protein [Oscillospiraceae bacterium]
MERLIICGGGHVAQALAQVAALLDFEIIVIDDRREFVTADRFPQIAQGLAMPFAQALALLGSRPDDFYCVLTRGHEFDSVCVKEILRGDFCYLGMIGSKGKVVATFEDLQNSGFTAGDIAKIHAPIGVKIACETPAEIAISIAAELVDIRTQKGTRLPPPPKGPGVLVTVLEKTGSAPRGVGAWMFLNPDGTPVGTIGGGAVEAQAMKDGMELWKTGGGSCRKRYDLSASAAGALGMVCGGAIEVAFRVVPVVPQKHILTKIEAD